MRVPVLIAVLLATIGLHACASAPGPGAVNLFTEDGQPRFHAYMACVSNTVNCAIVERAFDRWAQARHVPLDTVVEGQESFATGVPSPKREQALPYRVAMRFEPDLSVPANPLGGGSMRPMMSYTGTARVFDSATGQLLKTFAFKDSKVIDQSGGTANPYIDASVSSFIGHLDRGYEKVAAR